MSDDANGIAVARTYTFAWEAELARTVLEANGIPAEVSGDDAGGALPSLAIVFPMRLLVRARDLDAARAILDAAPADAADGDEAGEPDDERPR